MKATTHTSTLPRVAFLSRSPAGGGMRLPYTAALLVIALGFVWFEAYGAYMGHSEKGIQTWLSDQVRSHPNVKQDDEGTKLDAQGAVDKAWERIKFYHGHGYLMVVASFAFLLLIANASMGERARFWLSYVSLIAMVLYNTGWAIAGWLVPFKGAEPAKEIGEYGFFLPFGLTILACTMILAWVYARMLFREEPPPHPRI